MDGEPRPPLRPHGEAPYVVTGALYVEAVKCRTQMNSGMLQIAAGMLQGCYGMLADTVLIFWERQVDELTCG